MKRGLTFAAFTFPGLLPCAYEEPFWVRPRANGEHFVEINEMVGNPNNQSRSV